jgi:hypothetical protein
LNLQFHGLARYFLIAVVVGVVMIALVLLDGFEAMVLPRRVTRRWRPARLFYRTAWRFWRALSLSLPAGRYRENTLSIFGPLSLILLLISWVTAQIIGFGLIHLGLQTDLHQPDAPHTFGTYCYLSGTTFFTLGYGDMTPAETLGKILAVCEAGLGFGFLALIIGYLPVLYQSFSSREQTIALLDARAGSPPTASEFFKRILPDDRHADPDRFFDEWERWSADLLDTQLSFPVLGFYRSQHDNQSWLATLAFILDASATLLVLGENTCKHRAQLTFAIARHACVDLSLVFWLPPVESPAPRLTDGELAELHALFGTPEAIAPVLGARLAELRALYEPFLIGLSRYFLFRLPRFFPEKSPVIDNWQTSPWTRRSPALADLPVRDAEGHFG